MTENFDVIVIGSGIGGLSCGALLAHEGMKVLVLEQHTKIGGYAHSFKRRKFTFESGIHSVPLSHDGLVMHVLKKLGIEKSIECIELPSMFSIESPLGTYSMPSRYEDIIHYFKELNCPQSEITGFQDTSDYFYDNICLPLIGSKTVDFHENLAFMSQFHNLSYHDHVKKFTSSKALSILLAGQWPYAGMSAHECSAIFAFMMFLLHVREGSHFCKGGFSSLANAMAQSIISGGGDVLTKKCVNSLRVENNRVTHVTTDDGTEYAASIVISNISPYALHNELLSENARGKRFTRRLANLNPSTSCVIVYLGMKPAVSSILTQNIHFLFDSWDFESVYSRVHTNDKGSLDHLIMLRGVDEGDFPTLTLMNFVRHDYSEDWQTDKMVIAEKMLQKLDARYPGIRDYIEIMEVGSPDTFYRYTKNTKGALYGFENVKDMYGEAKLPVITHIPNLFQTGHWGKPGGGIWNVMFNAYGASKTILKSM